MESTCPRHGYDSHLSDHIQTAVSHPALLCFSSCAAHAHHHSQGVLRDGVPPGDPLGAVAANAFEFPELPLEPIVGHHPGPYRVDLQEKGKRRMDARMLYMDDMDVVYFQK